MKNSLCPFSIIEKYRCSERTHSVAVTPSAQFISIAVRIENVSVRNADVTIWLKSMASIYGWNRCTKRLPARCHLYYQRMQASTIEQVLKWSIATRKAWKRPENFRWNWIGDWVEASTNHTRLEKLPIMKNNENYIYYKGTFRFWCIKCLEALYQVERRLESSFQIAMWYPQLKWLRNEKNGIHLTVCV